jgi:hypothetical protein
LNLNSRIRLLSCTNYVFITITCQFPANTIAVLFIVVKLFRRCGTLKRKTRKEPNLKFYKVVAIPVVLYGSETWNVEEERLE